jgi:hypothetical protein
VDGLEAACASISIKLCKTLAEEHFGSTRSFQAVTMGYIHLKRNRYLCYHIKWIAV